MRDKNRDCGGGSCGYNVFVIFIRITSTINQSESNLDKGRTENTGQYRMHSNQQSNSNRDRGKQYSSRLQIFHQRNFNEVRRESENSPENK